MPAPAAVAVAVANEAPELSEEHLISLIWSLPAVVGEALVLGAEDPAWEAVLV